MELSYERTTFDRNENKRIAELDQYSLHGDIVKELIGKLELLV